MSQLVPQRPTGRRLLPSAGETNINHEELATGVDLVAEGFGPGRTRTRQVTLLAYFMNTHQPTVADRYVNASTILSTPVITSRMNSICKFNQSKVKCVIRITRLPSKVYVKKAIVAYCIKGVYYE